MMDGEGEPDLTPERLNAALAGPVRTRICCDFWIWGILYSLIIIIADIYRQKNEDCGIPVVLWCEIFFGICLLKTILVSFAYFGINSCSGSCVLKWYIVASAIGLLLIFAWVIYGYVIYFSEDNECQSSSENFGWLVLMVLILFFVIFALILVLIGLCVLSCVICCIGQERSDSAKSTIDNLTKQVYDPESY